MGRQVTVMAPYHFVMSPRVCQQTLDARCLIYPHLPSIHLLRSMLEFRPESMLGLIELLELRRRCDLWSLGLKGCSPVWSAKRLRISVREMTPVRRPEIRAPGNAAAETAGNEAERLGEAGANTAGVACVIEGVASGVAGYKPVSMTILLKELRKTRLSQERHVSERWSSSIASLLLRNSKLQRIYLAEIKPT